MRNQLKEVRMFFSEKNALVIKYLIENISKIFFQTKRDAKLNPETKEKEM